MFVVWGLLKVRGYPCQSSEPPRAWYGRTLFSGSVGALALVCAVLYPLTSGVLVACQSHGFLRGGLAHIWTLSPDGCNRRRPQRARIPAEFRARVFKPLGASGALREGLKTTSGGRLAGSAGV